MIVTCQGCSKQYYLPEEKVPAKPIRVRCPQCKAVFRLVPPEAAHAGSAAVEPRPLRAEEPRRSSPSPVSSPEARQPEGSPRPKERKRSRWNDPHERARRLARVLVSDILCYNRDKRDRALAEGNLMAALSEEIKKSWELYKEKVGPEIAGSTTYFKDALNEILADGQEVF
jgi:predicted Zn finger-like uncharacterized protein